MWILNVKFNASTWNFLSLVILSAIFNVSVLGFSMYFCLKNNKDLYLYYFIYYLFFYFDRKSHSHPCLVKQRQSVNKKENRKRKLFLYPCCLKY